MRNFAFGLSIALALVAGLASVSRGADEEGIALTLDPATGAIGGTVQIDGKPCKVAVLDTNGDKRFDGFGCDLNDDGKFAPNEIVPLSRTVEVKGSYYEFRGGADGKSAKLVETKPKLGTLEVGSPDVELIVASSEYTIRLRAPDGKWRLPVGNYFAKTVSVAKKDKDGVLWKIVTAPTKIPKPDNIGIEKDKVCALKVGGPPFNAKVPATLNGRIITMGVDIVVLGLGGEQYSTTLEKNGTPQPTTWTLVLVNEDGKVIATAERTFAMTFG